MAKHEGAGSSPHTRGAPNGADIIIFRSRIIPAYAGSTCRKPPALPTGRDHPRIRGEHPPGPAMYWPWPGSSPHTRGARECGESNVSGAGIIPAYAGSTLHHHEIISCSRDHPRIRGEHSRSLVPLPVGLRIIPAYAGSTTVGGAGVEAAEDHPRIRGEHLGVHLVGDGDDGSSPHTRGAHAVGRQRGAAPGIIPAYAGSTPSPFPTLMGCPDHPRIRGEHWPPPPPVPGPPGSSPHTRGALHDRVGGQAGAGIIPAYAGSTRAATATSTTVRGSSPHTRGALSHPLEGLDEAGIIPAYAGSTLPENVDRLKTEDHPRIRGEHPPQLVDEPSRAGSSPHTRGARRPSCAPSSSARIIPAYAGSTLGNPCNTKDRRRDYTSFPLPVTHPSGGGGS